MTTLSDIVCETITKKPRLGELLINGRIEGYSDSDTRKVVQNLLDRGEVGITRDYRFVYRPKREKPSTGTFYDFTVIKHL